MAIQDIRVTRIGFSVRREEGIRRDLINSDTKRRAERTESLLEQGNCLLIKIMS